MPMHSLSRGDSRGDWGTMNLGARWDDGPSEEPVEQTKTGNHCVPYSTGALCISGGWSKVIYGLFCFASSYVGPPPHLALGPGYASSYLVAHDTPVCQLAGAGFDPYHQSGYIGSCVLDCCFILCHKRTSLRCFIGSHVYKAPECAKVIWNFLNHPLLDCKTPKFHNNFYDVS